MNLKICYLKSDVSCEASVNFHHISQNATPATEFARCHHFTQPWRCESHKTSTTRLKRCACHAKWRWRSPKCCSCHEKCNASSESVAYSACHTKRLSTRYETRWSVTKCYACHAKRRYAALETSKSDRFCRTRHRHGHTGLTRPPSNGCGRLRTVAQRLANTASTPDPQSETGTHSGKCAFASAFLRRQAVSSALSGLQDSKKLVKDSKDG